MTFEGSVTTLVDTGGVAAAAGIGPSSSLSYTVVVDQDAHAFITTDGVDEIQPDDVTSDQVYDRFYATYVSGDLLTSAIFQPGRTNHVGQNETQLVDGTIAGALYTGNLLTVGVDGLLVEDWTVGTVAYVRNWWLVDGVSGHVATFATLTEFAVIPEPATGWLVVAGLLPLAGRRQRRSLRRREDG